MSLTISAGIVWIRLGRRAGAWAGWDGAGCGCCARAAGASAKPRHRQPDAKTREACEAIKLGMEETPFGPSIVKALPQRRTCPSFCCRLKVMPVGSF